MLLNLLGKLSPVLKLGDIEIRYYAICILTGAIIAYVIVRHLLKKNGYAPDLADTLVVTAFPAGLLGARIWWCISDKSSPWKYGDFWGVFTKIKDGGLAIQGGVILGVIVGILVIKFYKKKTPILFVLDCAAPQILFAQGMGRWGNFFNQEVYGQCINSDKLKWLPKFIRNQMEAGNGGYGAYVGSGIACEVGESAVPLFLYESFFNFVGWALLTFLLPKVWKKGRKKGDIFMLYFIWYGIVRMIMEPMRNAEFIMDNFGKGIFSVSVITSIAFIIGGIIGMVLLRVIKIKKKEPEVVVAEGSVNEETAEEVVISEEEEEGTVVEETVPENTEETEIIEEKKEND